MGAYFVHGKVAFLNELDGLRPTVRSPAKILSPEIIGYDGLYSQMGTLDS